MKKILLPLLLFVFALIGCNKLMGDTNSATYANYTEAQVGIKQGWVPDILPKSATEISEEHNLDTNVCYGSFKIPSDEISSFYSQLTPIQDLGIFRDGLDNDWDNKFNISKNLDAGSLAIGKSYNFLFAVRDDGYVYYRIKGEK